MLDPSFYPHRPAAVELRESHISWVFLAGDRAYKVKKALRFPFLDYGTLERRREMCAEEVRLNRRFAPEIYLGVLGIAHEGGTWSFTAEDDPRACEYAVEMRPIDEDRTLAALQARGALGVEEVAAVARRLAEIHADAPPASPERSDVAALVASLEENLATLAESCLATPGKDRLESARTFTRAFLSGRREDLERRARSGLVRECHGDLRAEHVIVPERGPVYVFDCVEFDPALREIDVATDLAFLIMDLSALGAEDLALVLVDRYRDAGGDPGDDAMLAFLASYRAWVRAKVACVRALELPDGSPERAAKAEEAASRFRLGHRFAWRARRPLVLVICGVAASGKTTLAKAAAEASGWAHLSSDVVRKRLAGVDPHERAGAEHYTAEFTGRTYRELGTFARERLEESGGVIVDATFHLRSERDAFRDGLGEIAGRLLFVECRAGRKDLLARVRARERDPARTSDADAGVVERQLAAREPLAEIPPPDRAEVATDRGPERTLVALESAVDTRI